MNLGDLFSPIQSTFDFDYFHSVGGATRDSGAGESDARWSGLSDPAHWSSCRRPAESEVSDLAMRRYEGKSEINGDTGGVDHPFDALYCCLCERSLAFVASHKRFWSPPLVNSGCTLTSYKRRSSEVKPKGEAIAGEARYSTRARVAGGRTSDS